MLYNNNKCHIIFYNLQKTITKNAWFNHTKPLKAGSAHIFFFYRKYKKCKFWTCLRLETAQSRTSSSEPWIHAYYVSMIEEDISGLGFFLNET